MVSAAAITEFLADRVLEHRLKRDAEIDGYTPAMPGRSGALSFLVATSSDAGADIQASESALFLVDQPLMSVETTVSRIAVADPRREFARVVERFFGGVFEPGIHPSATVCAGAEIAPDAFVGANAYVAERVVVGARTWIGPNAVLLGGTRIGSDSSVGPGAVIGHVGFGYAREADGSPVAIPHSGGVIVGDHVEIGANTCIDRGTMDDTVICDHVKIDNLVHIAHNCFVGESAFVIATAIVGGSVTVGPRAWIAPNASIRQKLTIGADSVVGLGACVVSDVPDGATVMGNPARGRDD
mgnify:FL=1